jgi:hydroxymethylglutaryl-CoA synthase
MVERAGSVVVNVDVDVCNAMGANLLNTVAEGLAPHLAKLTGARTGLRILTNLCEQRRTTAVFRIPLADMGWKGLDGRHVAERTLESYHFAVDSTPRAVTHNKGIMNGVDAVAIATGQDWRAIEAAAHAYAARDGHYAPLSHFSIDEATQEFCGWMEIPISLGTVGGSLRSHPVYGCALALLGHPDAETLAQVFVAAGLAQNFAAMRALATEGIQAGHMKLHARKISATHTI